MSGIVIILSRDPAVRAQGAEMLGRLRHRQAWVLEAGSRSGVWFGACGPADHVSLAGNTEDDDARWAAACGDLVNAGSLRRDLRLAPAATFAEIALSAGDRWGPGLFERLEGNYAVAVKCASDEPLIAGVDPRGVGQLHAVVLGDDVIIASEAKAFTIDPRFAPCLDQGSIAEMLVTGLLFDGRSLFSGVRGLALGCHFEAGVGSIDVVRHEDDRESAGGRLRGIAYLECMEGAIRELAAEAFGRGDTVLPLTGGLDSRLLLAALPRGGETLAMTFGGDGDLEVRSARRLAAARGIPHETVALEPRFLELFSESTVWLTEGRLNVYSNTTGSLMERFSGRRAMVSGSGGEAGRRENRTVNLLLDRRLLEASDGEFEDTVVSRVWAPRLDERALLELFGARGRELYETGSARLMAKLRPTRGLAPVDRLDLFVADCTEGDARMKLVMSGQWLGARAPFLTRRWLGAVMSGAPAERVDDLARLRLIRRLDPRVARVPWVVSRLPLRASEPLLIGLRSLSRIAPPLSSDSGGEPGSGAVGAPWGAAVVACLKRQLVKPFGDREAWLREGARKYLDDMLVAGTLVEGGVLRREGVRRLLDAQRAGADCGRALGLLLTLELWQRHFVGGE